MHIYMSIPVSVESFKEDKHDCHVHDVKQEPLLEMFRYIFVHMSSIINAEWYIRNIPPHTHIVEMCYEKS